MIAIRREDQSVWERRAPFAPKHVRRLVRKGVSVLLQPSNRRAYPMQVNSAIFYSNVMNAVFTPLTYEKVKKKIKNRKQGRMNENKKIAKS